MRPLFIALALTGSFFLAGCQTDAASNLPDVSTPSGKPEVTIQKASVEVVKSALMNYAISHGWTVANDTPNTLKIEKPADSVLVQLLFGSQMNAVPDARIAFTLIQLGPDTRVVADSWIVTNPGTGFEQVTSINNSAAAKKTYLTLTTTLPQEVRALQSQSVAATH